MKRKNLAILIIAIALLISLSCSISGATPTPQPDDGSTQIEADEGGALETPPHSPPTASPLSPLKLTQAAELTPTGIPALVPTATPTPAQPALLPLNTRDPQSILDWLQVAIENRDLTVFEQFVEGENINYANYIEGAQTISTPDYLLDLEERLASQPTCLGVSLSDYYLIIWYSNWSPTWEMTELCYVDCHPIIPPWQSGTAAFLFRNNGDEYQLQAMYLNTPWNYYFTDNLPIVACSQGVENFATATPSPSCPGAPPQRLTVGGRGEVCTRTDNVRLRAEAGRDATVVASLPPGTEFTVLGGPQCAGSNWSWWEIRTDDGLTGWVAEGGDATDRYFLCPLP
jgi:hypothetical protein